MSLALYAGRVVHIRHRPFRHRFSYSMWMLSVGLDDMAEIRSRVFRINRPGLVSLHERDHGARDGSPLRPWAEGLLRAKGLGAFAARIDFLCIPRMFGFAFNPIAFFFCRDIHGKLGAVIHQVKNTFGDQTAYVLPARDERFVRQHAAKRMHVSPFFDMGGGYRFALTPPDERGFAISIHYGLEAEPRMTASMKLKFARFSDPALLRLLAAMPLMPLKVFAAIHWEAVRLWVRGARYHPPPPPTTTEAINA